MVVWIYLELWRQQELVWCLLNHRPLMVHILWNKCINRFHLNIGNNNHIELVALLKFFFYHCTSFCVPALWLAYRCLLVLYFCFETFYIIITTICICLSHLNTIFINRRNNYITWQWRRQRRRWRHVFFWVFLVFGCIFRFRRLMLMIRMICAAIKEQLR